MVGVYSCSLLYRGIVFEDAVTDENLGPFESDRRSLFTSLVAAIDVMGLQLTRHD